MKRADFLRSLRERFPGQPIELDPSNADGLLVPADRVPEVFGWLKESPDAGMDYLEFITCVDYPPTHLNLVYSLYSLTHRHRLALKVRLDRHHPSVPSLRHLWVNADWNEREVYDLFGVVFHGHPDLRRLLMPDDWEGHPLRKDYLHPNLTSKPD
ncbi:MAG: NADH-quinone oxidoreductase subunit C [Candidatus Eremiobacterota bacterium]